MTKIMSQTLIMGVDEVELYQFKDLFGPFYSGIVLSDIDVVLREVELLAFFSRNDVVDVTMSLGSGPVNLQ